MKSRGKAGGTGVDLTDWDGFDLGGGWMAIVLIFGYWVDFKRRKFVAFADALLGNP